MVQAPPGRHLSLMSGSRRGPFLQSRFFPKTTGPPLSQSGCARNRTRRRNPGIGLARALRVAGVEVDPMAIKDWLAYAVAVSAGVLVTMLLGHVRW